MTIGAERERLHKLIDALRAEDVATAERVLEALTASGIRPLPEQLADAPFDDEPESDDERDAVAEARAQFERGEVIQHEEAMRRLGLK